MVRPKDLGEVLLPKVTCWASNNLSAWRHDPESRGTYQAWPGLVNWVGNPECIWCGGGQTNAKCSVTSTYELWQVSAHMLNKTNENNPDIGCNTIKTKWQKLGYNLKVKKTKQSATGSYLSLVQKLQSCLHESQNKTKTESCLLPFYNLL